MRTARPVLLTDINAATNLFFTRISILFHIALVQHTEAPSERIRAGNFQKLTWVMPNRLMLS